MSTHHIIVGGGPAATNALETIREIDGGDSTITLICDEPAHSRMALPYWLAGNIPAEHTHTGDDDYFKRLGVSTRFGVRVRRRARAREPGREDGNGTGPSLSAKAGRSS